MNPQTFDSEYQWNCYGTSGRTVIAGNFQRSWTNSSGNELILGEIFVQHSWVDRTSDKMSFLNLINDFKVTLSQVILSKQRIVQLADDLAMWLESPVDISIDLCPDEEDQKLHLYLEGTPNPPMILSKPSFQVEYTGIGFEIGKWDFRVDQSCIRILMEELRAALETLDNKREELK